MKTLRQITAIARTTALEGLQQPIALLLFMTLIAFATLFPLVQLFTFGEEGRLARDSGLALMLTHGLLLVTFTAGFTLADELHRGTAATVLTKPVSRLTFLLGKYCGVLTIVVLFSLSATLATLIAERTAEHTLETQKYVVTTTDRYLGFGMLGSVGIALLVAALLNFFRRIRFSLAAVIGILIAQIAVFALSGFVLRTGEVVSNYSLQMDFRIVPAATLIFLLLALYAACATAFSTRLTTGQTLLLCGTLLFLGFIPHASLIPIIPSIRFFWVVDALSNNGRISLPYLGTATLYAAAIGTLYLTLGYHLLKHRDLG